MEEPEDKKPLEEPRWEEPRWEEPQGRGVPTRRWECRSEVKGPREERGGDCACVRGGTSEESVL